MKLKKRILSLLLCGAMLFSLCSQSVLAEENGQAGGVTIGTSGLCEHHPEHNADCGYTEGTAGTPCNHEHTEDCYTLVTECVHEHDEDCYPEESVSGNEATPSGAQKREPTECTHACSEESGCITKELNCQHEHDDECGYSPATAGTPCGYVCELCGSEDSEKLATPSNAEAVTVASVQAMIDGLPNAEEITEDNAEEVKAQLEAIDEAKEKLSDEEIDELDMTRYAEAAAALGALAAPMLLANDSPDEQFSLTPGGTYYFDLSGASIPGTANSGNSNGAASLPDTSLHYVPFTYAGTIEAYKLTSAMATTEEYAQQNKYSHSLFVADYAVTHKVNWNNLDTASLIFGKDYAAGGVDYTLRAPSVGSGYTGSDDSERGTPQSNEWDAILDKANQDWKDNTSGYIKNWSDKYSFGQDNYADASFRAVRGYYSARYWNDNGAARSYPSVGFRPVLEILNTDPLISDSDRDLGDKNSNFTITYTVDDADSGDVLTATESLDGQTTKSFAPTRNSVNTISVDVDSLSLGKHTVKVVVSDGQGGTATRTWTFTRTNSAPTISGSDGNLGDKNLGFTYAYTIDDADGDTLTVVEELNDETIRTINNAPKGEELTVTITSEKLYALGLNSVNTLKITVTDGKGGTAYRRVTFKRTNSAPTISGQDKALGLKNGSFAENYTVSDVEGDNVVVTEFVDDVQIRSYQATLGQQETIELTREKWLSLTNGQHQLRIEAVDGNFATSVRVFSFSKKETVIKFELVAPEETDAAATKVLVTPTWKIEGAVAKVEACNNGFDAVPTWEDITAMVQINRVYNFTNKTKTASKWGVNIRFTITKNEGFEGEVSISGFGGAYE